MNTQTNVTDIDAASKQLLAFIKDEILLDDTDELSSGDDLLRTNILDSLGVMRLVEFIHTQMGRSVPPEDITLTNFISVDAICAYLRNQQT